MDDRQKRLAEIMAGVRSNYQRPKPDPQSRGILRDGGFGKLVDMMTPDVWQHGGIAGAAQNTARALQGGHYKVEYGPNGEVYQTDEWIPYEGGQMDRLLGVNPLLEFAGGAGVAAPLAKVPKGALMAFGDVGNIRGWHGGPHKFDKFDLSKIGTGEGAQAYGHGGYMAEARDLADVYRRQLSPFEVTIGGEAKYLDPRTPTGVKTIKQRLGLSDELGGDGDEAIAAVARAIEVNRQPLEAFDEGFNMYIKQLDEDIAKATGENYRKMTQKFRDEEFARLSDLRNRLEKADIKIGGHKGHLYEVELDAKPEEMLDWDKPLSEQSEAFDDAIGRSVELREAVENVEYEKNIKATKLGDEATGADLIEYLRGEDGGKSHGSNLLRKYGIKGIRYLDGNSRGKGEGTYNYVFFDDKDARILTRDGEKIEALAKAMKGGK